MEDRVMLNNSQGKKQEVEDHHRNVKFFKNKTSVTACNDSLNAKTSNVKFVRGTCGKYVLNDNHDKCVLHSRNGVDSRTKMPMVVPISTREPKCIVNQSVAKPLRRTVALESTNQKPRHTARKLYEHVTRRDYPIHHRLWVLKAHMKGNLKLLTSFVEKFMGSVKFGNDQIALIFGYRDLVHGAVTIKRVYYIKGLNHNLFSVGQFCDADLEVAFRNSTCYIRDLKGNDLLTEDIQCAGFDTRPPMVDRTDFASWQQRIRLYCQGKENGVNILKSIDEGPYQIGTVRETIAESTKRAPQFGLPKDIYTVINHYIDAKYIWDNVKMLLEGSELTKEDRESQLYDDFKHFRQHKGESMQDYYVWFAKLINDMRNIKMIMSRMQLNSKFLNNMLPEWGRFVTAVKLNRGLRDSNYDQ
nr:integrase, catalytic region, zinc finger, CCHC-type, peptidase aspartic, catalytic [Tanacetum cinerariifolium]